VIRVSRRIVAMVYVLMIALVLVEAVTKTYIHLLANMKQKQPDLFLTYDKEEHAGDTLTTRDYSERPYQKL